MGVIHEPINLVSGADDNFAFPLGVTLYSALMNIGRGSRVFIYILDGGISKQNKQRLLRVLNVEHVTVSLEWLQPNLSTLQNLKITGWHNHAAYLRLLMAVLLPERCQRVIYLDSDLVVEGNLCHLWEQGDERCPVLAVQDFQCPHVSCPNALSETYQALGLAPDTPYCNTGVMVINLDWWRAEDIGSRVLKFTQRFHQYIRYADQDGLNAIVAGRWGLLEPRWNVQLRTIGTYGHRHGLSQAERRQAQQALLRTPYILHYVGSGKPWHWGYRGLAAERFFHYFGQSRWLQPAQFQLWLLSRRQSQAFKHTLAKLSRRVKSLWR